MGFCLGCLQCISTTGDRYHPLFAEGKGVPPPEQRSRLNGYVRFVDGRDVSELGHAFELLPGCHVIGTPSSWGKGDSDGSVSAATGRIDFVIPMRAGSRYRIDVQLRTSSGLTGTLYIVAVETNSEGQQTGTFGPTTDQAKIAACLGHPPAE